MNENSETPHFSSPVMITSLYFKRNVNTKSHEYIQRQNRRRRRNSLDPDDSDDRTGKNQKRKRSRSFQRAVKRGSVRNPFRFPKLRNLLEINRERKISKRTSLKKELRAWLESKSVSRLNCRYCDLPNTTKSTISICFSPCGHYFASTHGDHTVKILSYPDGRVVQTLVGHERTPWTVKFHPKDSNIVASGCLAFDVRVWNIASGQTVRRIKVDKHVVGLDFHPFEPVLVRFFFF